MEETAKILRFMQFYAHEAHNLCSGDTFFSDHDFFGGLYPTYESDYDSVVERMIGLDMKVDINTLNMGAAELLKSAKFKNAKQSFQTLLKTEKLLCKTIEEYLEKYSEGTKQLLGEICNQSEIRQYKLKQRTV
jgi:DNA-binding ferritin-like protein